MGWTKDGGRLVIGILHFETRAVLKGIPSKGYLFDTYNPIMIYLYSSS